MKSIHNWGRTVRFARDFLNSDQPLDEPTAIVLAYSLPDAWRRLVDRFGHRAVLDCVRQNKTLGGAMFELFTKPVLR
jgi:hypothetical protein